MSNIYQPKRKELAKAKVVSSQYYGNNCSNISKILNNKKWVVIVKTITTLEIIYLIISVGNTRQINYMQFYKKCQ